VLEKIVAIIIELLEDQEGVKIEYEIKKEEEKTA
jgi:hypothetical protein